MGTGLLLHRGGAWESSRDALRSAAGLGLRPSDKARVPKPVGFEPGTFRDQANRRAAVAGFALALLVVSVHAVFSSLTDQKDLVLTSPTHRTFPLPPQDTDEWNPNSRAVSQPLFAHSWVDLPVVTELHEVYFVPVAILQIMQPFQRSSLLRKLVTANSAPDFAGSDETPTILFVQLARSFTGRLSALGTAMAYAQNTQRILVVIWEQDAHFVHPFRKLFETTNDPSSPIVVESPPKNFRPPLPDDQDWADFWLEQQDYVVHRRTVPQQKVDLSAIRLLRKHLYVRTDLPLESEYAPQTQSKELLGTLNPTLVASEAVTSATRLGRFTNVSDQRAGLYLHDTYSVPWDIINAMEGSMRRRLLDQFAAKEAKAGVEHRRPRLLAAHLQYGLGNRIRALGSAMAFAEATNRVLVVVWEADAHLKGQFENFFLNDLVVIRSLSLGWPVKTHHDAAFSEFLLFNLMKKDNPKITSAGAFWLRDNVNKHIYIKTAYVIKSKLTGSDSVKGSANSPISTHARRLLPVMAVQRLVERQLANGLTSMIGVHIRGLTIDQEIPNLNAAKEYTAESSRTTDYWRQTTQLPVFVSKLRSIPSKKQSFYVAADSVKTVHELERVFPGRIFFTPRQCDDRGAECLQYALADILCLSKTKYLLGSYWSSFTEAAIRLGGIDVYLAGVDFGKPT